MESTASDHEHRRSQVAEALWKVVRQHGLEGASMRRVAHQAGVSIGLVQHYFSSKEELERFAFDRVLTSAGERMSTRLKEQGEPTSTRELIRMILLESTIPTDAQRLAEYQVVLSFSLRALQRAELAQELRESSHELHGLIVDQLRSAQHDGVLGQGYTPESGTSILLSFAEGCSQRILLGHMSAEQGIEALGTLLDSLLVEAR